ncbi:Tol-Pal system beta propeller repeat protein TolB [Dongia rigui]|uniref:Tol-Pal system beta propeller repeat protein TolB n=1 Tax=Dongia rigui TaxID=940149 RepID=UPI0038993CD1
MFAKADGLETQSIAIPDFHGESSREQSLAEDVTNIIRNDLAGSGIFTQPDRSVFPQDPEELQEMPRLANWRKIGAKTLVTGNVDALGDGVVVLQFRLWGLDPEVQIAGFEYRAYATNMRRVAHKIADEIYERLTGESGYFDTRIAYVAESGPKSKRIKKIAIMDQDGANAVDLTDGSDLVLTPRFSPSGQDLLYMSYYGDKPRVYLFNIATGEQEWLREFRSMTFAPRFSPDGDRIILSMAESGNSDIYVIDIRTHRVKRLTETAGIDTAPSYSPDGSQIAFESDRDGSQQIYAMWSDGSEPVRISKGPGRYGTPVWSPNGDLIAFTRQYQGSFYIGVMRPDGSGERMLSQGWLIEGPSWAPNGRVLVYFKQEPSGKTELHSIDLTGNNERVMKTPLDGSDPAWSPLLGNQ